IHALRTHVYTHTIHTCKHTYIYSCIHIHLNTVIYIDIFWHNYTYVYIHAYLVHSHTYIQMYMYVCLYMYVCIYMHVYVCMYVYVYAYMCMYVCITYWGELYGEMSYPKWEGNCPGELSRGAELSYTRNSEMVSFKISWECKHQGG